MVFWIKNLQSFYTVAVLSVNDSQYSYIYNSSIIVIDYEYYHVALQYLSI